MLAEVLDARLHALWDPGGAQDRLATAAEIIGLARESADLARERRGLFWRFVALMELGRVAEAETALAGFERAARSAGDTEGLVMAVARHAMLAILRGPFDEAHQLIGQVSQQGTNAGMADTPALTGTLRGAIAGLRGDPGLSGADVQERARRPAGPPVTCTRRRPRGSCWRRGTSIRRPWNSSVPRRLGAAGRAEPGQRLGGRPRRVSAQDERARVNVTRTLRSALGQISAAAPKAGAHLAASVRAGRACRYEPAPGGPACWQV